MYVNDTQHEDFQTYELVYVLRHPSGRVELVVDNNGSVPKTSSITMCRFRQELRWRLKAQPGDTFTALVNTRGEHVIFETIPLIR